MTNSAEYSARYRERMKAEDPEGWRLRRQAQDSAYRAKAGERRLARRREAYRLDPAKHYASARRWTEKNREAHLAAMSRWQAEHTEERREYGRRQYLRKRDTEAYRRRAIDREGRRRAVMKGASPIDWTKVIDRTNGACGICGGVIADGDRHFDHIVPLAKGGAHSEENLQVAHAQCNMRKGAKVVSHHA